MSVRSERPFGLEKRLHADPGDAALCGWAIHGGNDHQAGHRLDTLGIGLDGGMTRASARFQILC